MTTYQADCPFCIGTDTSEEDCPHRGDPMTAPATLDLKVLAKQTHKTMCGHHPDDLFGCAEETEELFLAFEQVARQAADGAREEMLPHVLAYRDMNVCYRLGKRPSEKLFTALGKAATAIRAGEEKE